MVVSQIKGFSGLVITPAGQAIRQGSTVCFSSNMKGFTVQYLVLTKVNTSPDYRQ